MVYRFRGRYYALYNHWDSYPSGLGKDIVDSIPKDAEGYQKWLKAMHAKLCSWEEVLVTKVLAIPEDMVALLTVGDPCHVALEPRYHVYLDERLQCTPSFILPLNDVWIEWTYTIDLDNDLFIVNNNVHFALAKIPESWFNRFSEYEKSDEDMAVSTVQKELLATSLPHTQQCDASGAGAGNIEFVQPKCSNSLRETHNAGPYFFCSLWDDYRLFLKRTMLWTLVQLRPKDFAFREISFSILSLAAGLDGTVALIDRNRVKGPSEADWVAIVHGTDRSGPSDIAALVGHGYHKAGVQSGSAPVETVYWFKNVLVYLTEDLKTQQGRQSATTEAICYGRSKVHGGKPFNAILMSIQDTVLLRCSSSGLQITEPLPLLSTDGDGESDTSDHCTEQTSDASFFSLMHLFEASIRAGLKPELAKDGVFPTEIYRIILGYVDIKTQRTCLKVSRKFRTICQEQLFVTNDLILRSYDSSRDTFKFWHQGFKIFIDNRISVAGKNGKDFIITYGHDNDSSKYSVAPRLSWIGSCDLGDHRDESPWPAEDQTPRLPRSLSPGDGYKRGADHYWLERRVRSHIEDNPWRPRLDYSGTTPIRTVYQMWESILHVFGLRLCAGDTRLSRPPHTESGVYVLNQFFHREAGGKKYRAFIDVTLLQIQVGRPNGFYNVEETFDRLFRDAENQIKRINSESGQDWTDNFVAIAVGLSAELYQFSSKEDKLLPYRGNKRKRLNIFEEGDREEIEEFLKSAKSCETIIEERVKKPADDDKAWELD